MGSTQALWAPVPCTWVRLAEEVRTHFLGSLSILGRSPAATGHDKGLVPTLPFKAMAPALCRGGDDVALEVLPLVAEWIPFAAQGERENVFLIRQRARKGNAPMDQ